jgi:membrane protein implicated in regulation of membrane protease activity
MTELLQNIAPHWAWLGLGVLLCAIEIVAPGFFLMWLGLAAIATGIVAALLDISLAGQIGLFGILAIASIYAARRYFSQNPITSDDPLLNDRGGRLTGEIVTVVDAIQDGQGRVKVGDGVWNAKGPDIAVGARARVKGADGSTLLVEPV